MMFQEQIWNAEIEVHGKPKQIQGSLFAQISSSSRCVIQRKFIKGANALCNSPILL